MNIGFIVLNCCLLFAGSAAVNHYEAMLDARLNGVNFGDLEMKANDRAYRVHETEVLDMEHAALPRYSKRNGSLPLMKETGDGVKLVQPKSVIHAVQQFARVQLLSDDAESEPLVEELCDEHLVPGAYEQVNLFVYVDQCPTTEQNDTLKAWSMNMKKFLHERYSLNSVFKLLFPETCLKGEDDDAYDDLDIALETNPRHVNIAINIFKGGPLRTAHTNKIKALEAKHSVFNCFEFYMCHDEARCVPTTGVNNAYISNLDQVVGYSRLYLVRQFICSTVSNAVPIEYYDGNQLKCACRCPPGFEKNAQNECVVIESLCKCKWLQQCYRHEITSELDSKACAIKNWYGETGLVPIPFPHDNYVSFKKNAGDETNAFIGPHIELQVNDILQKYTWQFYQKNRESIFNGIEISKAGKYVLTLRAFDYGPEPETCSTTLIVEDKNPPTESTSCPSDTVFGEADSNHVASYTAQNYLRATNIVFAYKHWVENRVNDQCGNNPGDHTCDIKLYEQLNFNKQNRIERQNLLNNRQQAFQIVEADIAWMTTYIGGITESNKLPGEKKFCKKCNKFQHRFGENVIPYFCGSDDGAAQCQLGDSCALEQCLISDGTDFFTADVKIKPEVQASSDQILQGFENEGYNNVNQIHYSVSSNCTSEYATSQCQVQQKIKNMFDSSSSFKSLDVRHGIFGDLGTPHSLVRWRFKVEDDGDWEWVAFESALDIIFKKFKTTVIFEAWSACGKIAEHTMHVYLHLHTAIEFDNVFNDDMFFQSSRYKTIRADDALCNFPLTDFAELTFEFDPIALFESVGNVNSLKFDFVSLTCNAQFEDSLPVNVISNYTKNSRLLERYAVEFPNPTHPETGMHWTCEVAYKDFNGIDLSATLTKFMKFIDCDPPCIDCPFGECQDACPSGLRKPNTVCGGNQLRWDQETGKSVFDTTSHECCASCATTVCSSIFPGLEIDTIHYCKYMLGDILNQIPTGIPTLPPVELPTDIPTLPPVEVPTDIPTLPPVEVPTDIPTLAPVELPTDIPTLPPVEVPTDIPTLPPVEVPTDIPTLAPVEVPTDIPTLPPVEVPTDIPTLAPVEVPTDIPTLAPVELPTDIPTLPPVEVPTIIPTLAPVEVPTDIPTLAPVKLPTDIPTLPPVEVPMDIPTLAPVEAPTEIPSLTPVDEPTNVQTLTPATESPAILPPTLLASKKFQNLSPPVQQLVLGTSLIACVTLALVGVVYQRGYHRRSREAIIEDGYQPLLL